MEIEEKVFRCRRFVAEAMLAFGFVKADGGYRYETDFMNGEFSASLFVSDRGGITGTVTDRMNGEEYRPLRMEAFQGAYVSSVRAAYEALLGQIAEGCCRDVLFASDQANSIAEQIAAAFGVVPDYPWEEKGGGRYRSCGVFRHPDNAKWFALIMNVKRRVLPIIGGEELVDIVNLKADPEKIARLTEQAGIFPAYHMSHKTWISVLLDGSLTDAEVMALVNESFDLTKNKNDKPKTRRKK